jgi:hypothetical protein
MPYIPCNFKQEYFLKQKKVKNICLATETITEKTKMFELEN